MVKSEAFNRFSLEYDKWFENHKVEYEQELTAIKSLLPKAGRGIEIGAGTGRFTQPLDISLGVEPSKAMREIAIGRGINIVAGTAETIPVGDGSYDYALMVTTVCFLDFPETAFREVHRILKAEGLLIVGLIDRDSKLGKKYEKNKNENRFYKDAIFHSVEEVQSYLEKAGFSDIKYVQAVFPGDADGIIEPAVKKGYGEGSFVVMRAKKHDT
jgi:SAM-dependent methyltransferase